MRWKSHCHETTNVPSFLMVFFTPLNLIAKDLGSGTAKKRSKTDGPKWNMFIWSSLDLMLLCMTVQKQGVHRIHFPAGHDPINLSQPVSHYCLSLRGI